MKYGILFLLYFYSVAALSKNLICNEDNLHWDLSVEAKLRDELGVGISGWGLENIKFFEQDDRLVLRVVFPKGSIDPGSAKRGLAPLGGAGFKFKAVTPSDCMVLSYKIKFDKNFDWVIGGKLPGLFGGKGNSGGKIPNGFDGFSTRYMWSKGGYTKVYAYLPTSKTWGTPIGNDKFKLYRGVWHTIKQQIILNVPNKNNGRLRVWLDSKLIIDEKRMFFRKTDLLKLDGMMFSTFFGGGSPAWASKLDTHIDFSDFKIGVEYE